MKDVMSTDFLVIGSGIAGLIYAIDMAQALPDRKVLVLSKGEAVETGTKYAQGGIAVVTSPTEDSIDMHVKDTVLAGGGLCREDVVRMVSSEGLDRIMDLEKYGLQFDRDEKGAYDRHLEGGHQTKRILHFRDRTGSKIQETLLEKARSFDNLQIREGHLAFELIVENECCYGAWVLDQRKTRPYAISSPVTVLATGGLGHVFLYTTNPLVSTGDGVAMAHLAGAQTENLEFIQFHPTAFYRKKHDGSQMNLISEAVRGAGAFLLNENMERFMLKRHHRAELAPRDVVSREIAFELLKASLPHVFLDCRHFVKGMFKNSFPEIWKMLKDHSIDPAKDLIPVVPAAHYSCGGIVTDLWGRTNVDGLLACGECACTGMHGANRLASNSLLESLVFAHRCSMISAEPAFRSDISNDIEYRHRPFNTKIDSGLLSALRLRLQSTMSKHYSMVCNDSGIQKLLADILAIKREFDQAFSHADLSYDLIELRNLLITSELIAASASIRRQNSGCFWNQSLT